MSKDNKVFVIGIDGMDPKMTRRMVNEGKLPNIKKMIEMGSAREDLVLLGAMPTITPPMWTTLATGAYPATHGITCYWNQHPTDLSRFEYAFGSDVCQAEPVWNSIVEAGKKALVWTWPGGSWPPTHSSENLHVVSGVAPMGPNMTGCDLDLEMMTYASVDYTGVTKRSVLATHGGAGCVVDGETQKDEEGRTGWCATFDDPENHAWPLLDHLEGEESGEFPEKVISFNVPLKEPKNWGHEVPESALEFPVIIADGAKQLPALLLKNEEGLYDRVEVYMNKKDAEPWASVTEKDYYIPVKVIEMTNEEGQKIKGTRSVSLMKIEQNPVSVIFDMGQCLDITTDKKEMLWHPKSLYQ